MPSRVFKPCKQHECNNLTQDASGYCSDHTYLVEELKKQRRNRIDKNRESSHKRGYDSTWEKLRKVFLIENPLCLDCIEHGKLTPATEVHHIKKVKDFPLLRLVKENLMGLCKSCHSVRTAKGE
jgi:5-methylcytosine-specific restriction enzyme A